MTDPNAPAYPVIQNPSDKYFTVLPSLGLTIREHAILMMAQGLVSTPSRFNDPLDIARDAIAIADAVLKEMGREDKV